MWMKDKDMKDNNYFLGDKRRDSLNMKDILFPSEYFVLFPHI